MIATVTSVQRFATKTLYTRARATDGSTMLAPMSPGTGKGLTLSLPGDMNGALLGTVHAPSGRREGQRDRPDPFLGSPGPPE